MAIGTPVDLGGTSSASTGSLTLTTTNAANLNDVIILHHYCNNSTGTILSINDDASNTYQLAHQSTSPPMIECFWVAAANALASGGKIRVTFSGSNGLRHAIAAFTVSGLNVGIVDAVGAATTGTATSATSTSTGTLTQATELVVGVVTSASTPGTFTPGAGFTAIGGASGSAFIDTAYQIVAATTSITWAPTWVNSVLYRSRVASFMIQASPPSPFAQFTGNPDRPILATPSFTRLEAYPAFPLRFPPFVPGFPLQPVEDEEMGAPGVGGGTMGAP